MDFEAEYLAFIAAARARNEKLGLRLKKRNGIFKASGFVRSSYQAHHIIPRKCGGQNTQDNIVALTPDEHIVAHFLYNVSVQQQKNVRDNYCFGIHELNSILKFIPNVLTSFNVRYSFRWCDNSVADAVSGTIGKVAKFLCLIENVLPSDPKNYISMSAKIINSCFRRYHWLKTSNTNICKGKIWLCDLNFAA